MAWVSLRSGNYFVQFRVAASLAVAACDAKAHGDKIANRRRGSNCSGVVATGPT